jgi:hypothetical protein
MWIHSKIEEKLGKGTNLEEREKRFGSETNSEGI